MSTRCQIGIYATATQNILSPTTLLYNHSDGYPDGECGILSALTPLAKAFDKVRGLNDAEYLGAWALYALMERTVNQFKEYAKKIPNQAYYPPDGRTFLGYGICGHREYQFHGDIEWYYRLDPTGIKVYEVTDEDPNNWKLKKHVKIGKARG